MGGGSLKCEKKKYHSEIKMCMCAGNDHDLEQEKGTSAKSTAKARTALLQKTPNQTKNPNLQYCAPDQMQRQLKYKLCIPCISLL